ncbi:MAG: hydrolase [Gammaproteobacteria bacterium]|nr:hydrolase [Gammaproteobacteria bacterium]
MAGDRGVEILALTCNQATSRLVVIDIQEKLGAAMPEKVLGRVVRNVNLLLTAADRLGVPVTVSEQYPKGLGPTDARVAAAIPPSAHRFEKTCFSCADAEGFSAVIGDARRRQVILAGMESHVCVLQTAMDLLAAGFQPFVIEDAVCSRRLENYQNALQRLRRAGVVIATAESVVFEWLRDARHGHFKALSAMVR